MDRYGLYTLEAVMNQGMGMAGLMKAQDAHTYLDEKMQRTILCVGCILGKYWTSQDTHKDEIANGRYTPFFPVDFQE